MDSLFLLQFSSFIFMLVKAAYIGLSSLHARWKNKRYERSRWMLFLPPSVLPYSIYYRCIWGCEHRATMRELW